ncbi:MAG TPA: hypothetical protein VFM11_00790 [Burkholderiales bacterium]|nr:hypothetical protein [Burkholderiales bacterium]
MKLVIKIMMLVLIAWPPVSGFAATGMSCHEGSSQITTMVNGMQTVPCEQAAWHSDRDSRTTPISFACHGGICSFSCAGAAIPAAALLPFVPEFSTAYLSLADRRGTLFIPEQLQRPPLITA